jgi:hypothetical protein
MNIILQDELVRIKNDDGRSKEKKVAFSNRINTDNRDLDVGMSESI